MPLILGGMQELFKVQSKDDITFHVVTRFPLCAAYLKKSMHWVKNMLKWIKYQCDEVIFYPNSITLYRKCKKLYLTESDSFWSRNPRHAPSLFVVLNNSPTEMSNMAMLGNWQNFINAKKLNCRSGLLDKKRSQTADLYTIFT